MKAMTSGKNYLDAGDSTNAVASFRMAVEANPTHTDALVNLALAYLHAGDPDAALKTARRVQELDPKLIAAQYIAGCANVRLRQFGPALLVLQPVHDADMSVASVSFLLARAHHEMGQLQDALAGYQEALNLQPDHPVANYQLSQVLVRLGRQEEAARAIDRHNQVLSVKKGATDDNLLERCKYSIARIPFEPEVPLAKGIGVKFVDGTAVAFGDGSRFHGPAGVIDVFQDGQQGLFVAEATGTLRFLANSNGVFRPHGDPLLAVGGGNFTRCLVADLNHDKVEDVMMLGPLGSQVFRFSTNGLIRDVTRATGLTNLAAIDGALVDLDFTGKLDLIAVTAASNSVRMFRNLGNWYFSDRTATSGIPAALTGVRQVVSDDWNADDLADFWMVRPGQAPGFLVKRRGGALVTSNAPPEWGAADLVAVGDLNNDLQQDLVVAGGGRLTVHFRGVPAPTVLEIGFSLTDGVLLLDYDNDGWLDLLAWKGGLRVWRNQGPAGFRETTEELGIDRAVGGNVDSLVHADFDLDGDTDLVVSVAGKGLKFLRNNGGNGNAQLKLRLAGNRSNASGLGMQIELASDGWKTRRTVRTLPVEIGVGQHKQIDSMSIRWFDLAQNIVDVKIDPKKAMVVDEWQLPTGSCPFLYAWDGTRFRFVTDILGAAPVGLRMSDDRIIPADPEELVWIGSDRMLVPKDGKYVVQITSELREVLYLDHARLLAVEHPAGTEVHPLDKLMPGPPFPPTKVWLLEKQKPLREALRLDGSAVTADLAAVDGRWVSPQKLRAPQLRGLAEPHGVVLDFGPLETSRPLVLAMTGWLRFGGGMANVGSSHNPDLPFPFPILEVEKPGGVWEPVDVTVGAPCGKTKTILVDLAGKLPAGAQRLRLSAAFEIHWDRAALFERGEDARAKLTWVEPASADLHWRGFSAYEQRPWNDPLTPDYQKVSPVPAWRLAVTGWCTRYGAVDELISSRDEAFALVNGGDELTLSFPAVASSPLADGAQRQFFLYTDGWEKDADFHVELGYQVGPLPWHGMDDQLYGRQPRPAFANDGWTNRFNTRWVGPLTLQRVK
jgi:hypothetical protein